MGEFARVAEGRERWSAQGSIARHCHDQGYAAIVLSGGYEECGNRGRFRVGPGDVLLHDAFDTHLNRFPCGGAHILNLVLDGPAGSGIARIDDPDAVVRAAERDPAEARRHLRRQLRQTAPAPLDWPCLLARDLLADPGCRLDAWAAEHGLAPETVSRGFGRVFGVTPAAYRLEARTRRALAHIMAGRASLAAIAAATGFADQAHMSRALRALTGRPPSAWRTSNAFKTAVVEAG